MWQAGAAVAPLVLGRAVDEGVVAGDLRALLLWCAVLAALGAVEALAALVRHRHAAGSFAESSAALRQRLLQRALALDATFHDRVPAASLLARATSDVERVGRLLDCVAHTVAYAVSLVGAAVLLAVLDLRLAVVVTGGLACLTALMAWAAPRQRARAAALQEAVDGVTVSIDETVTGLEVVQGVGAERARERAVARESARVRERGLRVHRLNAGVEPFLDAVPLLVLAATVLVGGRLVLAGDLSVGELVAAASYVLLLATPTRVLGERVATVQQALASAQRLEQVLAARPVLDPPQHPRPLPAGRALPVELAAVRFGYGGAPVLDGVDLCVGAGERVGVIGPPGSGKSTLLRLLARQYDASGGRVRVGGADVREVDLAELRSRVALVAEPVLFAGTVADAVRFADPGADDARVRAAARAAGADGFVAALSGGYDAEVGERGGRLSGGQRQRVALARGVLPGASVLLLDDVTSALDPATEDAVLTSLREATRGATLVLATSRPSALRLVDRVVVLERGRLVADGPREPVPAA
ncbi:ABC transporter ATP-binding protein [Quadrisphaera sp. DSM 44207]|uniref:ABC transporter ATP-binding protein n=1 Tax=Quadrisphaera sp. DSM 44207 TaxID=1881057 RepID=UPI00088E320B|nr:ABC transporter ATP-binding protein [Quadrisphaera sp. DSM 44207]SDQ35845.1 ABC-type multidrug transport system, ATPase and permease component [Quadrisphaera sp. DSM 44207]